MPEPKEAAAITQGCEEGWHGAAPRVQLITPASHGCNYGLARVRTDLLPDVLMDDIPQSLGTNRRIPLQRLILEGLFLANFLELRKAELRRIFLLRTPVNEGRVKGHARIPPGSEVIRRPG